MTHSNGNGFLTASEVAVLLHITPETVRVWTRKGELPYIKLPGGRLRYDPDEIEQWVEAHHGSERDV